MFAFIYLKQIRKTHDVTLDCMKILVTRCYTELELQLLVDVVVNLFGEKQILPDKWRAPLLE